MLMAFKEVGSPASGLRKEAGFRLHAFKGTRIGETVKSMAASARASEKSRAGAQRPECARPRAQQRSKIRQFPTDHALGHPWLAVPETGALRRRLFLDFVNGRGKGNDLAQQM